MTSDPGREPLPAAVGQTRALREFLSTELIGGAVLLIAAAVAVAWANSPWQDGYHRLWETRLAVFLGSRGLDLSVREWINEALMAVFFLVVGLEIKRELLQGELREPRKAALPVIAAVGGMVVPALVYSVINLGGPGAEGWGIPMATDIAFALSVLAVVAPGIPVSARVFLLALAIVDDLGAIVVIALFYSGSIDASSLVVAAVLVVAVVGLRRANVHSTAVYVVIGVALWLALHSAGIHATIAGVAMGLLAPAEPVLDRALVETQHDELIDVYSPSSARLTAQLARYAVSRLEWLIHGLHPWTSIVVLPLFALANAGVTLSTESLREATTSRITVGVVVALVVGKTVGIAGAAMLARRIGIAELPLGVSPRQIVGLAALGGLGFTVSLFIAGLAFDVRQATEATVGVFVAAVVATGLATMLLRPAGLAATDASA